MAIELELTKYLEVEDADRLINQFPVPADYDGVQSREKWHRDIILTFYEDN